MSSQFRHKQPTRFNEPEIPQDLATKGYVDSQNLLTDFIFLGASGAVVKSLFSIEYTHMFGQFNSFSVTEAARKDPVCFDSTLVRHLTFYIRLNTFDASTVCAFRRNEGGQNMFVTVGTTLTGVFQDTTRTDSISNRDFISFQVNSTFSAAGSATFHSVSALCSGLSLG